MILFNFRKKEELKVLKKKFYKWNDKLEDSSHHFSVHHKKVDVMEEIIIFNENINNFTKIITHLIMRRFIKNLKRKARWEDPKGLNINLHNKVYKYFLKTGEVVFVEKSGLLKNVLWKYSKPLKYYLYKLYSIATRMKMKELEKNSNKWQIIKS